MQLTFYVLQFVLYPIRKGKKVSIIGWNQCKRTHLEIPTLIKLYAHTYYVLCVKCKAALKQTPRHARKSVEKHHFPLLTAHDHHQRGISQNILCKLCSIVANRV